MCNTSYLVYNTMLSDNDRQHTNLPLFILAEACDTQSPLCCTASWYYLACSVRAKAICLLDNHTSHCNRKYSSRILRNVKHQTPVPSVTRHEYLNQETILATVLSWHSDIHSMVHSGQASVMLYIVQVYLPTFVSCVSNKVLESEGINRAKIAENRWLIP